MSFLSAAYLLALPLIAVPVIIHLYRGRQRDVILWGAMQFLAAAVTKGRRVERLEELLLMLLRLAAVAALVFALARPMVRSSWLGDETQRQVILVLDNSLSTSRESNGESADQQLKAKAQEVLDSLSGADGVQILLAAGSQWATNDDIAADGSGRQQLENILNEVEPTQGAADWLSCLQSAVNLEPAYELASRRIIVLTDGQAEGWQADAQAAWQQLAANRDAAKFPISIEVVDCGLESDEIDNLAVTEVKAGQSLVRPGETLAVSAEVRNLGNERSPATRVQWLVAGKVAAESTVRALAPQGRDRVTAKLRFDEPGIHEITCRLDATDQVPLDQEDSLIVEVADVLPVLIVQADRGADRSVTAAELIGAALGYKDGQSQAWHSVYHPEVIPPSALATHALADYRAIVINDVPTLDRPTIERLEAFVRSGGGLWLAAGGESEPAAFNRDWYSDGAGLAPLALASLEVIPKADDAAATIHPPSRDHPATVQLANTTQLDVDEARIRQRWTFAERGAEEKAVSNVLESGNGQPLVVENYVGQGRVLVQSFPLGLEWSNLPLLKAYVVMVQDWLDFLTAPTTARYNLAPGAPLVASPPADAPSAKAELVTPGGRAVLLDVGDAEFAPVVRYSQTVLPGTYRVRFTRGGELVSETPFHVERDANESNLRALNVGQRDNLVAWSGLHFGTTAAAAPSVAESVPRREPVWGALLAALVALLAAELFVSNWLARQRHGFAISPTS
jgi:Aerotolerance regulator N-terminal/CARDB/von Willebrand factor type A domain